MGHRFYCFPLTVIVSGGLLGILAAPSAEIKTTECEINNSEPQTLRLVQKEFSLKYQGSISHALLFLICVNKIVICSANVLSNDCSIPAPFLCALA